MADKKVLLLGCNGQLGHECQKWLQRLGQVIAYDFPEIDFMKYETLRAVVRDISPDIIVNAAAYTAVDKAEAEPRKAYILNAEAPNVLAQEAAKINAVFVHYSTDYVFDGYKKEAYVETDQTSPLSVYGGSKRDGEIAATGCPRHLIFRTSWVIGVHGANFIKTMLRLSQERGVLRVVADQFGAPTSAELLAKNTVQILDCMKNVAPDDSRWGLYHLVASGETNWNGLARYVINAAEKANLTLRTHVEEVIAIKTAEYPTPAKRPLNSRLNTEKIRTTFPVTLPDWTDGVDAVLDQLLQGVVK